ncbi:biotin--[acetyl-CoA-carboxylase] ligase [Streptomyces sp. AC495_CC817]|uniref:biotin--[acetyl-CoA-carboxylase] ligase n=1 Tax=Streptomyces sp. AC495_CC817 TaxID=2823900 RepID=UPI001C278141|nr:biotin--[acetyl-CoA-carboxylase] ligase [Streptomyces sp. AC495_CC817]
MDLPIAAEVASRLLVLDETGSTNADLRERAADSGWSHLSVIATANQTAGRGRLDRTWTAPDGTAVAISVLLRRVPERPAARGWIPLLAGVAMTDAVAAQLPGHDVALKWPNDVLVDGRKICGILAEVVSDAVIVGTGVNTAMTDAQLPVPTATSFAALGATADVDRLLADYLRRLDSLLEALVSSGDAVSSGLHDAVTRRCATVGLPVRVMLPGDRTLEGVATGVDHDGLLVVDVDGASHAVSAGDVVHVRPV